MICLDKKYSTTRLLNYGETGFVREPSPHPQRLTSGGLHLRGYYKKTVADKLLVTIITAVFNSEKYVEDTIQSVINQTYDNVEYIIIDGCSTDKTLDIIREYDDTIDCWVSEPDGSMYEAINKGIDLSRGNIIAVLNSDDKYVGPDVIEQAVRDLQQYPDIDGLYGDLIKLYPTYTQYKRVFQVNYKESLLSQRGTFVPHATLFVRRDCIKKIGLYDTRYRYASDYDFILKCLKCCKLKYINRPFTYFRLHDESITSSGKIRQEKFAILDDHRINKYYKPYRLMMYVYLWSKYALLNLFNMKRTLDEESTPIPNDFDR